MSGTIYEDKGIRPMTDDLTLGRRLQAARRILADEHHHGHLLLVGLLDVEIGIDREGDGEVGA